jgi:dTMP kinase
LDEAMNRILSGRPTIKHYEAGQDLGLSSDVYTSFRLFQGLIKEEYDKLVDEYGLIRMDATETLVHQQELMRKIVAPMLEGAMKIDTFGVTEALHETNLQGRYL